MSAANLGAAPLAPAPPGGDDTAGQPEPRCPTPTCSMCFPRLPCRTECTFCHPVPVPGGDDGAAAALTRHEDGTISLSWPFGRPRVTPCTPEALEGMVEQHNALAAARDAALAEAARARAEVERLRAARAALVGSLRKLLPYAGAAMAHDMEERVEVGAVFEDDPPDARHSVGYHKADCRLCVAVEQAEAALSAAAGTDETGGDDQ